MSRPPHKPYRSIRLTDTPNLAFATMQPRQLKGTTDWAEYSITLPIEREAKQLYFGVLLAGTGKLWADDLELLVDGKPVWEAPPTERPKTPLELDHQFASTGLGVFYPDKRPTQRIGIVPDIVVRPTIAGVRAGRDEVLEEALRQILGRDAPADRIEQLARPGR